MTPLHLALARAERRLLDHVEEIESRLDRGEPVWREYAEAVQGLVAVSRQLAPDQSGRLLSTAELATRLGVSSKTVLRRKRKGDLAPALQLGQRGRAALRWAVPR